MFYASWIILVINLNQMKIQWSGFNIEGLIKMEDRQLR